MTLRSPRALLCCALLLACSCTQRGPAACASGELQLVTQGRLTAGVDLGNAPFGFLDAGGHATGFEVELLTAMAKAMELKLTLVNRSAPALIPAAIAHRVDVAAASFRDDAGLPNDICTSTPYLDGDLAVLAASANADQLKSVDALRGRGVVVISGTAGSRWATAHLASSRVVRVETIDDAISELRAGHVDAALVDRPLALRTQTTIPQMRAVTGIRIGAHYVLTGAPDTAVMAPVDTALQTLKDDGTLDDLKKKWFGPGL